MNQVVVFYNPYLPELKISINGKKLSAYSSLMSNRHQRFEKWGQSLFTDIYREINAEYEVLCISNEFICSWLECLAEKNPHCLSFSSQALPLDVGIYDRLSKLELLGCNDENETVFIPIINASADEEMTSAVYDILEEQGVFEDISEEGIVWSDCPLVNVQLTTCDFSSRLPLDYPCAIALCGSENDDVNLHTEAPVYALVMGTETRFIRRQGSKLYFSVAPNDIGEMIVNILEEEVLCPTLSELSYHFPSDALSVLTEKEKEDLELICQASPTCKVSIPADCDVGRIVDLHPQVYPSDMGIEYRVVSDATDVINVEDGVLYPRNSGMAEVSVFVGTDPYPVATERIRVHKRVLLTNISVFPATVYMPIGGSEQVKVSVFPENAQNVREIAWESSDTSIATVDAQTGRMVGIGCGKCIVTASTKETLTQITVNVQPEMEDIVYSSSFIEVAVGEQKEWRYQTVPENAYGADLLRVISSDANIAEYRGGYIIGKNVGNCRMYIKNQSGSINCELRVTVIKGKRFW